MFITVEGIEGSGKSSIINFVEKFLRQRGFKVAVFREPGSTRIGEKIRSILLDKDNKELSPYTELLLYLAARTQLIEEKLKGALKKYDVVICDRFFDSTVVYQGYALGLGRVVQRAVNMFNLGIKPDLTILLDTRVENGLKRIKRKDRIESRPLSFHRCLKKGYKLLAKENPQRIHIINADRELFYMFRDVERLIKKHVKRK